VKSEDLKPNKILRGPLFPEPVQVLIATPMGPAVTNFTAASSPSLLSRFPSPKRLKRDYYLYVVFHCATVPSLEILQDPATPDWQPIVKVEHYRLRQDSIKHPVELKEDPPPYRTGGVP
jgi:hypothetical protein